MHVSVCLVKVMYYLFIVRIIKILLLTILAGCYTDWKHNYNSAFCVPGFLISDSFIPIDLSSQAEFLCGRLRNHGRSGITGKFTA